MVVVVLSLLLLLLLGSLGRTVETDRRDVRKSVATHHLEDNLEEKEMEEITEVRIE
jgi:hypothetical protein